MKVKVNFEEFEVKIEDAVFKCREADVFEISIGNMWGGKKDEVQERINTVNRAFNKCVLSWTGIEDGKTGEIIPFSEDNKVRLTFDIKIQIFNEIIKRSRLNTEEKKT